MKVQELFEADAPKMGDFDLSDVEHMNAEGKKFHKALIAALKSVDKVQSVELMVAEDGKGVQSYDVNVTHANRRAVTKAVKDTAKAHGFSAALEDHDPFGGGYGETNYSFQRVGKVNEKIEAEDPSGTVGTNVLYKTMSDILRDAKDDLSDYNTSGSSHSLGGNMRAMVSGEVKLVKNYQDHHSHGSSVGWDLCLQVGNAVKDIKALDEIKKLYNECLDEAKDLDPKKLEKHSDVFHAYFDDGSVSCKYEYARSFCWIAIRKNT